MAGTRARVATRECYWAYPDPGLKPRYREPRHVTFGCLNNIAKVNPPLIDLWAKIMHRVPGSRLWLLVNGGATNILHLLGRFHAAGIEGNRIDVLDRVNHAEYMLR